MLDNDYGSRYCLYALVFKIPKNGFERNYFLRMGDRPFDVETSS